MTRNTSIVTPAARKASGDGHTHERRGAGRRDHDREQSGEEAAELARPRRQAMAGADKAAADLRKRRTGSARPRTAARPCRRRTPATGTGTPSRRRSRRPARPAAQRPVQRMPPARRRYRRRPARAPLPPGAGEADDLQRQHRKHAGHQVEDQAAKERQHQRPLQGIVGRRRRDRARVPRATPRRSRCRCGRAPKECRTRRPERGTPCPDSVRA